MIAQLAAVKIPVQTIRLGKERTRASPVQAGVIARVVTAGAASAAAVQKAGAALIRAR